MKSRYSILKNLVKGNEISLEDAKVIGDMEESNLDLPFKYVIKGDNHLGGEYRVNRNVYPVTFKKKDLVAKFNKPLLKHVQIEDKNLKFANKQNISVPAYEGLFNVYNINSGKFKEALIMEQVKGKSLFEIENLPPYFLFTKLLSKINYSKSLSKAKKYFNCSDIGGDNAIFEKNSHNVILLDTEFWRLK